MKRIACVALAVLFLFSLAGCNEPELDSTQEPSSSVAPTEAPTADPSEDPSEDPSSDATEGPTDPVVPAFDPEVAGSLIGTWKTNYIMTGEMLGDPSFSSQVSFPLAFTFDDQGNMSVGFLSSMLDNAIATYTMALKTHNTNKIYQYYYDRGYNKAGADDAMRQNCGMSVEEYVQTLIDAINFTALFNAYSSSGSYSTDGSSLYLGWDSDSTGEIVTYSVAGNRLTFYSTNDPDGWGTLNLKFPVVLTRVAE